MQVPLRTSPLVQHPERKGGQAGGAAVRLVPLAAAGRGGGNPGRKGLTAGRCGPGVWAGGWRAVCGGCAGWPKHCAVDFLFLAGSIELIVA